MTGTLSGAPLAVHGRSAATWSAGSAALGKLDLRQVVTYQPASRYWDFQWIETGIFVALALGLKHHMFTRWLSRGHAQEVEPFRTNS